MLEQHLQNHIESTYELRLRLKALAGELDLNFKGTSPEGNEYVVKLMRQDCPESLINFQCAALLHLATRGTQLLLPQVCLTQDNRTYQTVEIEGEKRILWILSYCPGYLWAEVSPHSPELLFSLGVGIATLTTAFEGFSHPAMNRKIIWNLTEAMQSQVYVQDIQGKCRELAEEVFDKFEQVISPKLTTLPHSVIHNDANDYNVLVQIDEQNKLSVNSIFDFGDMSYQPSICELAIALTYAIMGQDDPIKACIEVLKGYSTVRSLGSEEIHVLLDLIKTRLAVSIAISSHRQVLNPDDSYITISQAPAKDLFEKLSTVSHKFVACKFRHACGLPVLPQAEAVYRYLDSANIHPVMKADRLDCILDLGVGSLLLGANPSMVQLENLSERINKAMQEAKTTVAFGRYAESRRIYDSGNFGADAYPTQERRTHHLGLDIFCEAGSPVFTPLDGTVELLSINELPLDYGGLVILRHEAADRIPFFTLYGHLSHDTRTHLHVGQRVQAGDQIATLGHPHENGGWPPHLHVQIILDLFLYGKDFPGVCLQSEASFWHALSPNPAILVPGLDIDQTHAAPNPTRILQQRKKMLGFNLSISYQNPLHIVSGFKQYLYDSHAHTYLDVYNNVPHVGHAHPKVVKAVQDQIALLNTNTRYLHEQILIYAERLTAKLPQGLDVCFFVNSASEANELALRLARTYTRRKDMLVVEAAYHGHTSSLIEISPYKHNGLGGEGAPDWVHTVPIPDDYRGPYKRGSGDVGLQYATEVQRIIEQIASQGKQLAAFIAETYPSVGGQIMPPQGYLKAVYEHVRAHGALCIADEVQTGFGRLGDSFWGIDSQGVVPDMVILGKPIANGFPMGAVVTTREIAEAFDNGMEFFSTFGGNPVACAAATAVLDVVKEEQLQLQAATLGKQFISDLKDLQTTYPVIGDVRGEGFFLGMELVRDPHTLEPAAKEARYVVNRLRDHHILAGIDGPLHNVIKIRPSMVVNSRDMEEVIERMYSIFSELSWRI